MAKTIIGIVSANKSAKTIVVTTHSRRTHPIYKKAYSVTKKFMAHDEKNEAEVGDRVAIVETRPISSKKRFKLDKILFKPVLREEALAATKDEDDNARPESKAKKVKEEEDDTAGKQTSSNR